VILAFLGSRLPGRQILTFSQAPDGKSDDVNHAEAKLLLQRRDEMKVRVREPNRSGLKFLIFHHHPFSKATARVSLLNSNQERPLMSKRYRRDIALRRISPQSTRKSKSEVQMSGTHG
jgi:hypothetical protein